MEKLKKFQQAQPRQQGQDVGKIISFLKGMMKIL